jgi:SPP1 family predicted phage head-tail adaptor
MAAINPGALRHRITIQSLVETLDEDTGIVTAAWVDFATVWGKVTPISVKEFSAEVLAGGILSTRIHARIQIRYLPGIAASMRVLHPSTLHETFTYNILTSLPDPDSGAQYLTLAVSEVLDG